MVLFLRNIKKVLATVYRPQPWPGNCKEYISQCSSSYLIFSQMYLFYLNSVFVSGYVSTTQILTSRLIQTVGKWRVAIPCPFWAHCWSSTDFFGPRVLCCFRWSREKGDHLGFHIPGTGPADHIIYCTVLHLWYTVFTFNKHCIYLDWFVHYL